MSRPDTIMIGGRAFSWRAILELRRNQLEEWQAARPQQPALFQMQEDRRPVSERSAGGRYQEPTLLSILHDAGG